MLLKRQILTNYRVIASSYINQSALQTGLNYKQSKLIAVINRIPIISIARYTRINYSNCSNKTKNISKMTRISRTNSNY